MEAAQERVKNAVTGMIRDLDKNYFRKMQVIIQWNNRFFCGCCSLIYLWKLIF